MSKVPFDFDKEKFLNSCPCGCTKNRQFLLDGIEKYKESDPKMVQYLEWYRDKLWEEQVIEEKYQQMYHDMGEKEFNKKTAEALRAMADELEKPGMHFMISCNLPSLPIFSGEDKHISHISVTLASRPMGG